MKNSRFKRQRGFSLIEVLVAMVILAVSFLALAESIILAYRLDRHAKVMALIREVASDGIEELATRNPFDINAQNSTALVEPEPRILLRKDTLVVVNADNSRAITVTVSDTSSSATSSISLEALVIP
jgi:prepilin-type N-terminal cleavage/methylation domain-containing protein